MRRSIAPALLLACAAPFAAAPALACSPAPGYAVPTNLELAAGANLILIGEVVGERPALPDADDPMAGGITIRPIATLKGLMPGEPVTVGGTMLVPAEDLRRDPVDRPLSFTEPDPSAYMGGCIRREFASGTRALFVLDRRDGQWVPAGGPFSRWAEDVTGPEDPWVQLVTLYAHAAQLDPDQRMALFEDQLDALQARRDDEVALAMAADIEKVMAGPNEPLVADLPPVPGDEPEAVPEPDTVEAAIDRFGAADQAEEVAEEP